MINFWAVFVAAIASIIIGGIWWGPLFGKIWMEENGLTKMTPEKQEQMKKSMTSSYLQQFILSLIQAAVLAHVLRMVNHFGAVEGALSAAVLWLGFIFPIHYASKLWGNKSYKFILLTLLSSLITMLVMGAIVGAWIY